MVNFKLLKAGFHPNYVSEDCKQRVKSITPLQRRFLPINRAVSYLTEAIPLFLQYGASINFSDWGDDTDTVPHLILIKSILKEVQSTVRDNLLTKTSQHEKSLCHIISAGALISKEKKFMHDIISFERKICNKNSMELIGFC